MAIYNKRTIAKLDKLHGVMTEMKKLKTMETKLKAELLVSFNKDGISTLPMDYGTFYTKQTLRWTYSDIVGKLADKLSALKAREQNIGTAESKSTESLGFRPSKV